MSDSYQNILRSAESGLACRDSPFRLNEEGKLPHAPSLTGVAGGDEVVLFLTQGRMHCIEMLGGGSQALDNTQSYNSWKAIKG